LVRVDLLGATNHRVPTHLPRKWNE